MLATLTSKGRITLSEQIRDRLGLDAGALLAAHGGTPASLVVTDVVLAEAVWTLRSAYAQDKAAQLLALRSLLDEAADRAGGERPSAVRSNSRSRPLAVARTREEQPLAIAGHLRART